MKTREELKQLRVAAGMTQQQLAEKAGINAKTLIKFEQGRNVRPSIENAIRTTLRAVVMETPVLIF